MKKAGTILFKDGDYGDLMYVIIKGSVSVRKLKPNLQGKIENCYLASLGDGIHFGALAMMSIQRKKRYSKDV